MLVIGTASLVTGNMQHSTSRNSPQFIKIAHYASSSADIAPESTALDSFPVDFRRLILTAPFPGIPLTGKISS